VSQKTSSILFALFALVGLVMVSVLSNTPVQAQSISTDKSNCANCHENLYFLHDTGNWFCLRESPMSCVDCHGGDPEAVTRETAHTDRAGHPVINADVSKCQECHPEECDERVELFDQTAGISQIRVAAPYIPVYSTGDDDRVGIDGQEQEPSSLLIFWEIISPVLLTSLALAIYFVARRRHN